EAPTWAARAVIASSGATGFGHAVRVPSAHTLAALMPFVGVLDAVGPITAMVRTPAPSGSAPVLRSSTEPRSAIACATDRCSGVDGAGSAVAGSGWSN